jgi:hypothetical protein
VTAKASRIPPDVRRHVHERDRGCVGPRVGMPGRCFGGLEQNHIRPSGGLSMKSRSTADNLVDLCSMKHHPMATENGPEWRPKLIAWVDAAEAKFAAMRARVGP